MRSASLFVVLGLVFVLAVSSLGTVAAVGGITICKGAANGDTTTVFHFKLTNPDGSVSTFDLQGGSCESSGEGGIPRGVYTFLEDVPPGWALTVRCDGLFNVPPYVSTFEYVPGGVIITYYSEDTVACKFINSPVEEAVGGVVIPANTLGLVTPWIAVIGLVGCISTVVAVAKKRHP